jgi:Neuraminidase (sialidase)
MDRLLVVTYYAGIGVAVSFDNGVTWQRSSVPLPPGIDQGASNPTLQFDDQGHIFVSYEAAMFLGPQPPLTNPTTIDLVTHDRTRTYGFQANNGIFVVRSDDGGLTWGAPVAVASHLYTTTPVPFEINAALNTELYRTLPNGQANPYYEDI